jgi:hypothetical protein
VGKTRRVPKCRFSLRAFWFVRGLNIIRTEEVPIPDRAAFRREVRPYRRRRYMALYLNRDDFQTGCVWADFTGPRAWVAQFVFPGGTGTYACSTRGLARLPERIVFRIENEQVDEVHKSWTIPKEDGMRAFEHFLLHGERHPRLTWVEQPGDLWEPAEPSAAADHGDT